MKKINLSKLILGLTLSSIPTVATICTAPLWNRTKNNQKIDSSIFIITMIKQKALMIFWIIKYKIRNQ